MAHVVVYLQRTTRGLHPGSAVALCLGREVADARGASVVSLCLGDAGAFDDRLIVEASRAGTDQVVFLGPEGIQKLFRRLAPRHVFAPYTREAGSVLAQAGIGPMVGRWIDGPPGHSSAGAGSSAGVGSTGVGPTGVGPQRLESVIGVVAGTLPWRQSPMQIEPEYEADVTQVELPDWLVAAAEQATNLTTTADQPPLMYLERELDDATQAALGSLGAFPVTRDTYLNYEDGTLLWFDADSEGLPLALVERSPGLRVILLIGEREVQPPIDASWGIADFVLGGPWPDVVRAFNGTAWKSALA